MQSVPKAKKATGRPLIPIDWEQVDEMLKIQCTGEEIAGVLKISYDTIEKACKREQKMAFTDYSKQKGANGKSSLRRRQWAMTESNPTMAIWLGKQWLGQTDKNDGDNKPHVTVNISAKDADTL